MHLKQLGLLFIGATLMSSAWAQTPDRVNVRGLRAHGQGCPIGSASAVIAPDNQSFSLLLDEYMAQADSSRPTARRDCDIELDLDVPSGWAFALVQADYRGFVDIPAGALATHRVVYAFEQVRSRPGYQDGRGFEFKGTEFRGPQSRDYLIQNTLDIGSAPRSGCSMGGVQTLYMNTLLTARLMNARGQTSLITLDSVDGVVASQTYQFAWFRCDQFAPTPHPPRMRPQPPGRQPPPSRPAPPPRRGR